ncbi:MAG: UTP--glucose-1-phosphate uridylyltransferase [Planctomycetota bacterium]
MWSAVEDRLLEAQTPELFIKLFRRHYENLKGGSGGYLREADIEPVSQVTDAEELEERYAELGRRSLDKSAVLKLNGGLGTGMGLDGPKSLLPVRGNDSFLSLIVRQASRLSVPLVLMNSFSTDEQTSNAMRGLEISTLETLSFLQHQVPKIDAETFAPADWPSDPRLTWCPPGHGDIYAALVTSGTLQRLLDEGRRYVFVSNADNLGATMDERILGHFIDSGSPFLMEVADRKRADRKGGHLALSDSGGYVLREKAQCHPEEETSFQDTDRHRYFNTNNLWLDLSAIAKHLEANDGILELPTIVNQKTINPRDSASPKVYQLETAMGAAIGVLEGATAIRVPRTRFAPVKTTGDLLAVRSDAYEVREDASVGLIAERNGVPPTVKLDERFYKTITDLEARVPVPPSLRECESLTVEGDHRFERGIVCKGNVKLKALGQKQVAVTPAVLNLAGAE